MKTPLLQLPPALAGATTRDIIVAGLGAILGTGLTGFIAALGVAGAHAPLIVAPIGASAVLVFAVPSSPLAQPWSVVGGNVISCLVGLAVGQLIADPALAAGAAVGAAIILMSALRCLHPPGGAVALMTVLAVHQPDAPDLFYAFLPVGVNSVLLILFGLVFHRFSGRTYPHAPAAQPESLHGTTDAPPPRRGGFVAEDVDMVLAEMGESFDIDRGDLEELLRRLDERTFARLPGSPCCGDIMSRDVVSISYDATTQEARKTMRERRLRCLPLVNRFGVYLGMVEARHLMGEHLLAAAITTSVPVARPDTPALAFASALSSGRTHEVVVLDDNNRIVGLITQTDMLAAALRALNRSG